MITIDDVKRNLSMNLPRLRKLRGLTQVRLSELTGVNQGTISTAEQGLTAPNIAALANLAEALGVTVDDLTDDPSAEAVSA